ncbi:hypothetical protein AeRB84_018942 [Aphanomyces euteiches]|nr:hypothetical protein AeRB84_018942 [Aphanomyces euteiches]
MAWTELTGRVVARRHHGKSLYFCSLLIRKNVPPSSSCVWRYRIPTDEDADDCLTIQICFQASHFKPLGTSDRPYPHAKKDILHGDTIRVFVSESTSTTSTRSHLTVAKWQLVERIHPDGGTHQQLLQRWTASTALVESYTADVPADLAAQPRALSNCKTTRMFATVSYGFQDVAAGELIEKVDATDIQILDGKVVFTIASERLGDLRNLRSVEKLFVLIGRFNKLSTEKENLRRQLESVLPAMLSPPYWSHVQSTWQQFHKRTAPAKSFRVTTKITGTVDGIETRDASQSLAAGLTTKFQLEPELKEFDVEVFGHLQYTATEGSLLLGLTLVQKTMAYVDLGKHVGNGLSETGRLLSTTTLRPTIAYNLTRIAHIEPGHFVVDPMCGCGTIPEVTARYNHVYCIAGDFAPAAIERSAFNLNILDKKNILIDVVQWDARRLPLRSHLVDALVTDMPFGKRMGSHAKNNFIYPEILGEFARVTTKGSGNAVLLTTEKELTQRQLQKHPTWVVHRQNTVSVGGLDAKCYHLTYL